MFKRLLAFVKKLFHNYCKAKEKVVEKKRGK